MSHGRSPQRAPGASLLASTRHRIPASPLPLPAPAGARSARSLRQRAGVAAVALGLYLVFQLRNPGLQFGSAVAATPFFASGIFATVAARRTMTILAQKSFLLELRDRHRIAELATPGFPNPASRVSRHVTISIGVAVQTLADEASSSEQLQRNADAALYLAKQTGRNPVLLHRAESSVRGNVRSAR